MRKNRKTMDSLIGIAVVGSCIIGIAGLIVAIFTFFMGNTMVGALCLIASALSFGLLANSVLRE